MSIKRWDARRDANEPKIVEALEAIGCTVIRLDVCDLLVGRSGKNWLIEVKDGSKKPSDRKLTKAQIKLRDSWNGQYAVATSVNEALSIVLHPTMIIDMPEGYVTETFS